MNLHILHMLEGFFSHNMNMINITIAGLKLPESDMSASSVDLTKVMRKISNEGVDIVGGQDKNARRRTALVSHSEDEESPEMLKLKRLKSLQRTLMVRCLCFICA